jgi:hypothetical protein
MFKNIFKDGVVTIHGVALASVRVLRELLLFCQNKQ